MTQYLLQNMGLAFLKMTVKKNLQETLNLQKSNSTKMNVLLEWEEIEQRRHVLKN